MKQSSLRKTISIRFALLVLIMISLISVVSNILISYQFENYVKEHQESEADHIAQYLSAQYAAEGESWNIDYVHGMGMAALDEGFIIKLYDKDENVLWDAENHDMSLCHDMMQSIKNRMQEERPDLEGSFLTHRYDLNHAGVVVGYLDISYYSPYYMDENAFQFISALNEILLTIGCISLIGAVIMGVLLANYIVKPISKTVEITERISSGDYNIRFKENVRTRELYDLAQAVNQMAESLEEQELLRKQLTSDVTHELRTPIANVLSYVEMMIEGILDPTQERLQNCYGELQRLSSLISDLERLGTVESDNLELHKSDVNLQELSRIVMGSFESQLREKQLEGQVRGDCCVISIDRSRIQQVLTNLISNAVKYSNTGGTVRVIIEDTEEYGIIHVEDEGIGIPERDLKRIFERFYRTDKSRNRKTGGAGIGLTIVKAIVEAHGGKISVESQEGKGSVFQVMLPKIDG